MSLFRQRKQVEEAPRPDRSGAITVKYYPGTTQYNRRNCLFHGELAVTVCPNCGTLFCMECIKFEECPRCRTPLNFVDGSKEEVFVDDRDVIETEQQKKAIQQRWAQKRMAEAERDREAPKGIKAKPYSRDAMSERALKIAEKVMKAPAPSEPTVQTFQSSQPQPEDELYRPAATVEPKPQPAMAVEPAPQPRPRPVPAQPAQASQSAPAVKKKKGANSLVAAALGSAPSAPEPSEPVAARPEPSAEELAPEEIVPEEKKDKMERLKELLDEPEVDDEGGANRDLSRL